MLVFGENFMYDLPRRSLTRTNLVTYWKEGLKLEESMSAIAGIYHLNDEPMNLDHGRRLMEALQKYPADDIQTWHKDHLFLGCHAQWITPESVGERLPNYDSVRQLAITADAIIDNRDELFEQLQIERERRAAMPDSQLILLAYCKWEEDAPKYLVGDFAFMIWDERERKLFGARDFSGSRTLYYYRDAQRLAFCTTIEPLLALPYVDKRLNEEWLAEFLAIPGMQDAVDPIHTAYKGIMQVPPSHSVTIDYAGGQLSRYCTLAPSEKLKLKSDQDYVEAFRDVYKQAIVSHIRTHHQVGARLSGGLDSGSIVSFASNALRESNKKLYTFSYIPVESFEDWTPKSRIADERPFIQSTVQYVGNIIDYYLDFEGKSPFSEVDDCLELLEMPYKFFENSYWLKGIYERANQEGIGVLINGGRGNFSVSWGPALDYYAVLLKSLNWLRLYREMNLYCRNKGMGRKKALSIIGKRAFPLVNSFFSAKDPYHFPMLINPEFAEKSSVFNRLEENGFRKDGSTDSNVFKIREKHFQQANSWNLNGTSRTKLSLKYKLLDRDPTNDLRVVRFCLSVPQEQFVKNGFDRALIRRSTENFLPEKVRLNQNIRGIQGADGVHRMKSDWKTFIDELRMLNSNAAVSQLLNLTVINDAITKLQEGPKPDYMFDAEFKILMRSLIVSRFIKKFA